MKYGRKRVLLVYPKFPPSFWGLQKAVRMSGRRAALIPLGLVTVAAMLPEDLFEVRLIDMNVRELRDSDIAWADIVMVTAMQVHKDSFNEIIIRSKRQRKIVVVGGPYPTIYPEEVVLTGADYLVLGEAEVTLRFFLEDLAAGRAPRIYSEASVRSRVSIALTREFKPHITITPIPLWRLLEMRRYASMAVQYSRGCPNICEFCAIYGLFGHIPRVKTPEQMIAEIESLWRAGWRGPVFFVDDNFIGNRGEVRRFLPILIAWQKEHGYPFSFYTEAGIDLANEDMRDILDMMVQAGFDEVFVGIESIDPEVLESLKKRRNRGDQGEKIAIIQKAGLKVTAGFIWGNDMEKLANIMALFHFIQEHGIVECMPGLLNAFRGTPLYLRLQQEGRLRGESGGNNTHAFSFNFVPRLDEQALIEAYIDLLEKLFSPRNYFERCRTLRNRLGKASLPRENRISLRNLMTVVKVFCYYLILHPSWEFVRFMSETTITAPSGFAEAVANAVKFVHYESITTSSIREYRAAHPK